MWNIDKLTYAYWILAMHVDVKEESKMPLDSISEHQFLKFFLGGMPPDPLELACFACSVLCTLCWGLVAQNLSEQSKIASYTPVLWLQRCFSNSSWLYCCVTSWT